MEKEHIWYFTVLKPSTCFTTNDQALCCILGNKMSFLVKKNNCLSFNVFQILCQKGLNEKLTECGNCLIKWIVRIIDYSLELPINR